jgi:hypothetical protein
MYLYARQWGIQPSEFWNMTIAEWWLEYETNAPSQDGEKFAGKLTRSDVDDLKAWMEEKDGASRRY